MSATIELSKDQEEKPRKSTHHNAELIRALTPITIAIIGGIIGVKARINSAL